MFLKADGSVDGSDFNRTIKELKYLQEENSKTKNIILIAPLRNWNIFIDNRESVTNLILIAPLRNWNSIIALSDNF